MGRKIKRQEYSVFLFSYYKTGKKLIKISISQPYIRNLVKSQSMDLLLGQNNRALLISASLKMILFLKSDVPVALRRRLYFQDF